MCHGCEQELGDIRGIPAQNNFPSILTKHHRWELPVLRYHGVRGNYHYPFLGVICSVILHESIRQNYHKNQSYRYPFFLILVNYPTFLINEDNLKF